MKRAGLILLAAVMALVLSAGVATAAVTMRRAVELPAALAPEPASAAFVLGWAALSLLA